MAYHRYMKSKPRTRFRRSLFQAYTSILPDTAIRFVLEALIPYSKANVELAFKPNTFFNHLEQISDKKRYSRSAIKTAYFRARKLGYIDTSGTVPRVTEGARQMLKPYRPTKLKLARLLVMFDIPEDHKNQRDQFRQLLRELKFVHIQKSVWSSEFDSRAIIRRAVYDLDIAGFTIVYEAVPVD